MTAPGSPRVPRGPFARPFDVRSLKGKSQEVAITATTEECEALARALDLPAIGALHASFRVVPRAGERVEVSGTVEARVTRTCVVSVEDFESVVTQGIGLVFAPPPEPVPEPAARGERGARRPVREPAMPAPVAGNDDQEDPPDPLVGNFIDLGAVAAEFMVLALEPYPKKPGVHFDDMVVGDNEPSAEPPKPSAFAALARLKDGS